MYETIEIDKNTINIDAFISVSANILESINKQLIESTELTLEDRSKLLSQTNEAFAFFTQLKQSYVEGNIDNSSILITNLQDTLASINTQFNDKLVFFDDDFQIKINEYDSLINDKLLTITNGTNGVDGKSAYELAVENGFIGTVEEYLISLNGINGLDGLDGENGTNGVDGKSAYDLALENGFIGTVEEYLLSLNGTNGTNGNDGQDGTNGVDGKSAYELAIENGFTGTIEEYLISLNGTNGIDGNNGQDGINGVDGKSSYELAVENGFVGTDLEFLDSLKLKNDFTVLVDFVTPKASGSITLSESFRNFDFILVYHSYQGIMYHHFDWLPVEFLIDGLNYSFTAVGTNYIGFNITDNLTFTINTSSTGVIHKIIGMGRK